MPRVKIPKYIHAEQGIPLDIQKWMDTGARGRSPMADSVDESGSVTRTELLWAATHGPQDKVDIVDCPSRLAISLWRFAHDEPGRFHTTYGSKLVERQATVAEAEGSGHVDPAIVKEAKTFQRIGAEFIKAWESSRDEGVVKRPAAVVSSDSLWARRVAGVADVD